MKAEIEQKGTKVTEKPILFTAAMVKAILDGSKTQTRRIVKPQPIYEGKECYGDSWAWTKGKDNFSGVTTEQLTGRTGLLHESRSCYGVSGDRLWVREAFYQVGHWEAVLGVKTKTGRMKWKFVSDSSEIRFVAPPEFRKGRHSKDPEAIAWHKRLARFMPRAASRITLEIQSIRVERLQDVSEADALAEGIMFHDGRPVNHHGYRHSIEHGCVYETAVKAYQILWESINGPGSWDKNPWVWVIEFKRL